MHCVSTGRFRVIKPIIVCLTILCLANLAAIAAGGGQHYTGRVLYRANKAPVAGVLVEAVEAEDNGEPTDEVLGSTRADADGRFTVALAAPTNKNVTLVVSAVRASAESGGDHRQEGFDIKTHRTQLGFLPRPSPTRPNTIFVERRQPGRGADN